MVNKEEMIRGEKMVTRVRNPGYSWYQNNHNSGNGWYNSRDNRNPRTQGWGRSTGRTAYGRSNSGYGRTTYNRSRGFPRYGYGYKRPSKFGRILMGAGILAGKAIKGTGALAQKSFHKAKEYTDTVKANRQERESNIYYSENAEFSECSFNPAEMLEILDVPANSIMCATETGVKLAKRCADVLTEGECAKEVNL